MVMEPRIIEFNGVAVEFRVDETLAPSVLRVFAGTTPIDTEVDSLPVPRRPTWLRFAIQVLRAYRTKIGHRFAHRCVFEPSCSRYAELALREKGMTRGAWYTVRRLWRCRPGRGGVDLP